MPDVLSPGLRIVFVGINPGRVSAAARAHFANPRNDFWRLLHAAGLTTRVYEPQEQFALLELPRWTLDLFPGPLDMVLLAVLALTVGALAYRHRERPSALHLTAIALVAVPYFAAPFEVVPMMMSRNRYSVISAMYSRTPPTMAPSRLAAKASPEVATSANRCAKMRLAR